MKDLFKFATLLGLWGRPLMTGTNDQLTLTVIIAITGSLWGWLKITGE